MSKGNCFLYYRQKDLFDITDSRRYNINVSSDGEVELTIRKATTSDEGLYYCLAQSSSGRSKCSAALRVIGEFLETF